MSILLKKIIWYRVSNLDTGIVLDDCLDYSGGRGLDIKNNVLTINLKNSASSLLSTGSIQYKYMSEGGQILFEEKDIIKVYMTHTDDASVVEDTDWSANNNTTPDDSYLLGTYYVIEHHERHNKDGATIELRCADKTYILFNRLLAKAFIESDGLTAPEIIQKVVRFSSQNPQGQYLGTGGDAGARYDIDAKLEDSESGYIQEARKATTENGNVNADTTFPTVVMGKIWKPVYEWISELSQIENLNTADELASTGGKELVYGRPFLYYVDEDNIFHWFETEDTVETENEIDIQDTSGIYDYDVTKAVWETINFIIWRGGEDLYDNGTLGYYYESNTDIKGLKMRVIAMTDVAKTLIEKEITNGNLVANTSGSFTFGGTKYNRNGTVTPHWSSSSVSTDDDYNDSLEAEIKRVCNLRARNLVQKLAHARYKGRMSLKGAKITPGTLYKITNKRTGQVKELIRAVQIRHIVNTTGWETFLELEQDNKTITEMS